MRLPRVRFTVRRLMVVVAAVALILGGELTRRRGAYFRTVARSYAGAEEFDHLLLDGAEIILRMGNGPIVEVHGPSSILVQTGGGGSILYTRDESLGFDAESLRRRTAYHALLRRKYERAARYPWLPVEPDSPEPKMNSFGWLR